MYMDNACDIRKKFTDFLINKKLQLLYHSMHLIACHVSNSLSYNIEKILSSIYIYVFLIKKDKKFRKYSKIYTKRMDNFT